MQHDALRSQTSGIPTQVEIESVPFYAQEKYQCGPAALAMVFAHAGVQQTPDQLASEVFIPGREGSLQIEMLAASRRFGLVSVTLQPQLKDLLTEVAAGQPVVVLQNLALSWYSLWHYAVVVGYDLDKDIVILRSGTEQRQELPIRTFEHTWARSNYWAMLALPPDQLPKTVAADDYVQAVARLETGTSRGAARRGYATALQRWPDNFVALIGQGNAAYADHDLTAAIDAYRRATIVRPDAAIAFNNLAQALVDAKRTDEAKAAAARAVQLARPEEAFANRTEESIKGATTATVASP